MYAWLLVCTYVYICIEVYVCVNLYMYVCRCTHMCLCARVGVACIYVYMCVQLCVTAFQTRSCDPNSVTGDPDSCRCRPDTQAIQRQIHGMTSRSVPVRAVKTRWRFGTASFHVSVCSYVFTIIGMYLHVTLIILCDFLLYLPVWLLVSLHETSMIVHFNYLVDMSLYQHYFMCL